MAGSQAVTWRAVSTNSPEPSGSAPASASNRGISPSRRARTGPVRTGRLDGSRVSNPSLLSPPRFAGPGHAQEGLECSIGWTAPSVRIQPRARCRTSGQESQKARSCPSHQQTCRNDPETNMLLQRQNQSRPCWRQRRGSSCLAGPSNNPRYKTGIYCRRAGLPTEPATFSWRGGWRRPRSSSHSGH